MPSNKKEHGETCGGRGGGWDALQARGAGPLGSKEQSACGSLTIILLRQRDRHPKGGDAPAAP